MKVTPKTEEEVSQYKLWEKGIYSFEILEKVNFGTKEYKTSEAVSQKGNEMIVLVVQIFNDNGGSQILIDYLMDSIDYKIRHAAVACGFIDQYQAGTLNASDFIGKCGRAKIGISKGKKKDDGSGDFYPDKNSIADYVVDDVGDGSSPPAGHPASDAAPLPDDTIPF